MDSEGHQQLGYGLPRFRSAPGSLLGSFADNGPGKVSLASDGFETGRLGSMFMGFSSSSSSKVFQEKLKQLPAASPQGNTGLPPQYPRSSSGLSSRSMEGSYGAVGKMGMDHRVQPKLNSYNLARQSSSPPGFSRQLSTQNGYAATKGTGNYRVGSGFNGESSTNNCEGQFSFSSLGMLPLQISEIRNESLEEDGPGNSGLLGRGISKNQFPNSGFHFNSWGESLHFSDNFTNFERDQENDVKLFSGSQSGELRNRGPLLSHRLSSPRSSPEMSAMEKLLQFQDSIPCRIRAKRGCATHPRSIAERVRRTRISERMRKLKELIPKMDKQANTADMLDLAVEYIKDLQEQYKVLSSNLANCDCSDRQKSVMYRTI